MTDPMPVLAPEPLDPYDHLCAAIRQLADEAHAEHSDFWADRIRALLPTIPAPRKASE